MVRKQRNTQILVYLLVTYVPGGTNIQSGVPVDLPLPPQPVIQTYPECWPMSEAVGSHAADTWNYMSPEPAERRRKVVIVRVDCIPFVQFRIERNLIFQLSLEFGIASASEIRAIRCVLTG